MPLDPHLAATHRVTPDSALRGYHLASAGEPKIARQMPLFGRWFGQAAHAFNDLDQALLALPLFPAGGWHFDPKRLGSIEQRSADGDFGMLTVEI